MTRLAHTRVAATQRRPTLPYRYEAERSYFLNDRAVFASTLLVNRL